MYCTKCGQLIKDGARFCGYCGNEVSQAFIGNNVETAKTEQETAIFRADLSVVENSRALTGLGYAGAVFGILSVFFAFFQYGWYRYTIKDDVLISIVIILIGAVAAYGIKSGKLGLALASGQAYFAIVTIFFLLYMDRMADFRKMGFWGKMQMEMTGLGPGYAAMFIAFILLIASATLLYKLKLKSEGREIDVRNALVSLEQEKIEINNALLPTWAISLAMMLVTGISAVALIRGILY